MHLLNIGGRFPGNKNTSTFTTQIADIINDALNKWFPPNNGVTVIAEPGRYFVASAFTLSTKIHSIKNRSNDERHIMYFINDGVYGSFNSILYDHTVVSLNLYMIIQVLVQFMRVPSEVLLVMA